MGHPVYVQYYNIYYNIYDVYDKNFMKFQNFLEVD